MHSCIIINVYALGSLLYSANAFFPGALISHLVGFATPACSQSFFHLAEILARTQRFAAKAS
jgi:hypothetical protein